MINNHRKPRTLSLWCCKGGTEKIEINNPFLILCSKNSSTLRTWLRKLTQTLESLRDSEIHAKRRKGRRFGGGSGAGKALGRRGLTKPDDGGGIRRARARAAQRDSGEKEEKPPAKPSGRGLYAPAARSPDALYVAPDASGDHRTHAQRGLHFGIAPDDGHRTLALASGASGYAW